MAALPCLISDSIIILIFWPTCRSAPVHAGHPGALQRHPAAAGQRRLRGPQHPIGRRCRRHLQGRSRSSNCQHFEFRVSVVHSSLLPLLLLLFLLLFLLLIGLRAINNHPIAILTTRNVLNAILNAGTSQQPLAPPLTNFIY